jgi:hypothetical protein
MAGATLLLVGCSSPHPEGSEDASLFDELIEKQIELAEQGGASDEQIHQLETARDVGEVTAAQMRAAMEATRSCMAEAGITVSSLESHESQGMVLYGFTTTAHEDDMAELTAVESECYPAHSDFVLNVYDQQPAAQEALWAAVEDNEAALRQCLTDMGGIGIDELDTQELWSAAKDQSFGGADYGYSQEVDCVMDVGIGW